MLRIVAFLLGWYMVTASAASLPRPDHVVVVIEENHAYSAIIGNPAAPYINALAQRGALFTSSYGVTHPSQPNYLALFSGTTHDVRNDMCPLELSGSNLAEALLEKNLGFAIYSDSMPKPGFIGCRHHQYVRKHNPVANWRHLQSLNLTMAEFPENLDKLPTVSMVIPDQNHDMHDGSIAQGDAWLSQNIQRYETWAYKHNSLLIVTWDEDDGSEGNRIATIFAGPMIKPGNSTQRIDHYNVLRTLADMYGLSHPGNSATALPLEGIWTTHEH